MSDPFPKSFRDFLTDRINHFDFKEASADYQSLDREIQKLHQQLLSRLDKPGAVLLGALDDQCCLQMGKAAQIAYLKGFAECLKLILDLYQK